MNNILEELLEVGYNGVQKELEFYVKFKYNGYF